MTPHESAVNEDAFKASPEGPEKVAEFKRFLDSIPESPRRTTRSSTRSGAAAAPPPVFPAPPATKRGRKKASADKTSESHSISAPAATRRSLTEDFQDYLGGPEGMDDVAAALGERLLTPIPESPLAELSMAKTPTTVPASPILAPAPAPVSIPAPIHVPVVASPAPLPPTNPPKAVQGHLAAILPPITRKFPPPIGRFSPPNPFISNPIKTPSSTAVPLPTSTPSSTAIPLPASTPSDRSRSCSPSPTPKQHIGRPSEKDRVALDECFDEINTDFQLKAEELGISEHDVRLSFERWAQEKPWTTVLDTSAQSTLEGCFREVQQRINAIAKATSNTPSNVLSKYHAKFIAIPRAPNSFNQYEAMTKAVRDHKNLNPYDASTASQKYSQDKERGVLDNKLAVFSTLKAVDGGNISVQSRERMFESHTQNMDRLVKAGDKQHLHTLALSVGASIHQDQSILHLAASPLMQEFIANVLKITVDEFLGLVRAYACWHVSNAESLQSHVSDSVQDAMKEFAPIPLRTEKPARQLGKLFVSSGAIASSSKNPTPATSPSKTNVAVDPLPLIVRVPPLGINLRKQATSTYIATVITTLCTLVAEHSETVPEEVNDGKESKARWGRLPGFLAKAGIYITNYPVRGVIPGLGAKDKGASQGIKGIGSVEAKTLAVALSSAGGELQLHRANPTDLCSSTAPVIITGPPLLTPAEKVTASRGKNRSPSVSTPVWPYPAGIRFFLDGHWDFEGPPAKIKEDTAIVVPDDDDEDDSNDSNDNNNSSGNSTDDKAPKEPLRGHKRTTSTPSNDLPSKKLKTLPATQELLSIPSGPQHSKTPVTAVSTTTAKAGPPMPPASSQSLSVNDTVVSSTPSSEVDAATPATKSSAPVLLTTNQPATVTSIAAVPSITNSTATVASSASVSMPPNAPHRFATTNTSSTPTGIDGMDPTFAFLDTSLERAPPNLQAPPLLRQPSCDVQSPFHQGVANQQPVSSDIMGMFQLFLQQHAPAGAISQLPPGTDQSVLIAQMQQAQQLGQLQQQAQQAQQLGAYQGQGSGHHAGGMSGSTMHQAHHLGGPGVGFPGPSFGGQGGYFGGGHSGF